jgi:hypothetical protein
MVMAVLVVIQGNLTLRLNKPGSDFPSHFSSSFKHNLSFWSADYAL